MQQTSLASSFTMLARSLLRIIMLINLATYKLPAPLNFVHSKYFSCFVPVAVCANTRMRDESLVSSLLFRPEQNEPNFVA